ncbi:hypothetical protein [Pseudomonas sp. AN-1]|uniref:hypothetical protein n=1 Tax=Pseudomonas sp. AN-1 TaxID=3096605 RepID=UPI002A6B0F69|nr:hypothetical protein [Pseudomonas sp. AN-1]WPP47483.1 hypothetical protein SK095_08950 [Pseudomonas sp. AN-1]
MNNESIQVSGHAALLDDEAALAELLTSVLYESAPEEACVAVTCNPRLGLAAMVCYGDDPDFPSFWFFDYRTGQLLYFDSDDLIDTPTIHDMRLEDRPGVLSIESFSGERLEVFYELGRQLMHWNAPTAAQ